MFAAQGLIPPESANWSHVSELKYLVPAMEKASFLNTTLNDTKRKLILQTYYKFMMIRNPLERLASAYCDKIEHSLIYRTINTTNPDTYEFNFFSKYRREILARYNHDKLLHWEKSEGNFSLQPSFSHYVRWIVDSDDKDLNEHFTSTLANTEPCRVRYNFYANFKNFSRDIKLLIDHLHLNPQYFVDKSSHISGEETGTKLLDYYSELPRPLKKRLFHRMFRELDFYYNLYPEDQWSHLELLEVNESVHVHTAATAWLWDGYQ